MHRLLLVVSIFLASFGALNAAPAPASAAPSSPAATEPADKSAAPSSSAPSTDAPATPAPVAAPKITYSDCHVDGQYIAMTFDDGPHKTNTPRLLDMLKERHIHATFFLVGENVVENQEIVKRILAEGHELGNHSWSHPNLQVMGDAGVRDQLQRTQDAITKASGVTPKLLRPPYGSFTTRQKNWAHGEFGFTVVLWDVDPEDWKYRNAERVKREILKAAVSGSIVLSHDIHKTTVDAMPEVLDTLTARGFKFVTVSQLISMDRPKVKATPVPKASPVPKADSAPTAKTEPAPAASAAPSKP
jgi:peptidoglycan/xylan/chitin deacetylase (PgdA/CDA1 family)